MEHQTTQAEQSKTDSMAVFGEASAHLDPHNDLVLIGRVDVPRYSEKSADGEKLSDAEQYQVAVHRALDESGHVEPPAGEEFMVMDSLDGPMSFVEYDPSADV